MRKLVASILLPMLLLSNLAVVQAAAEASISFNELNIEVEEANNSINAFLTLSEPLDEPAIMAYQINPDLTTVTIPGDMTLFEHGGGPTDIADGSVFLIEPGVVSVHFNISLNGDEEVEEDETLVIDLLLEGTDPAVILPENEADRRFTFTILDNDGEEEPPPVDEPEEEEGLGADFCAEFPREAVQFPLGTAMYLEDNLQVSVKVPLSELPEEIRDREDFKISYVGLVNNRLNREQRSTGSFLYGNHPDLGLDGFSERPDDDGTVEAMQERWGLPQENNGNDLSDLDLELSTTETDENGDLIVTFNWADARETARFDNSVETIVYYQVGENGQNPVVCNSGLYQHDDRYAILNFDKPTVTSDHDELLANAFHTKTTIQTHSDKIEGLTTQRVVAALSYLQPNPSRGRVALSSNDISKTPGFGEEFMDLDADESSFNGEEGLAIIDWGPEETFPDSRGNDFAVFTAFSYDGRLYETPYLPGGESIAVYATSAWASDLHTINTEDRLVHWIKVPKLMNTRMVVLINNYHNVRSTSTGALRYAPEADEVCAEYINGDPENPNTWGNQHIELEECKVEESEDGLYDTYIFISKLEESYPVVVNTFSYNVVYREPNMQFRAFDPEGQAAFHEDNDVFFVLSEKDYQVTTTPVSSYAGQDKLETVVTIPTAEMADEIAAELREEVTIDIGSGNASFNRGSRTTDNRCFFTYDENRDPQFQFREDWANENCDLHADESFYVDNGDGTESIHFLWSPQAGYFDRNQFSEGLAYVDITSNSLGTVRVRTNYFQSEANHHIYPTVEGTVSDAENLSVSEGETRTFTLSIPKAFDQDIDVQLTFAGTSAANTDYTFDNITVGEDNTATVTIPAGETEFTFEMGVVSDGETESEETIEITSGILSTDADNGDVSNAFTSFTLALTIPENDQENGGGGGAVVDDRGPGGSPPNSGGGSTTTFNGQSFEGQSTNPEATSACDFIDLDLEELAQTDPELADAIQFACANNLLKGQTTEDGQVADLAGRMTRAEFVTFVIRFATEQDCSELPSNSLFFTDVPNDETSAWYYNCLVEAVDRAWMVGYLNEFGEPLNLFKPSSEVNYAEALKVFSRMVFNDETAADLNNNLNGQFDELIKALNIEEQEDRFWFTLAMLYFIDEGLIEQPENLNEFAFQQVTRGEAIRLLYRLYSLGLI